MCGRLRAKRSLRNTPKLILALEHHLPYIPHMKQRHTDITDLLTTADAAKILKVHVGTISRMVAAGRLTPALKIPGKTGAYLFHPKDIEALTLPTARAER